MLREGHASLPPKAKRRRTHAAASEAQPATSNSPNAAGSSAPLPNGAKWFRNPSVVWFRGHDLRVEDHPALLAAAQRGGPVAPLFIWDEEDNFGRDLGEVKRWWLKMSLMALIKDVEKLGVPLYLRVGRSPVELRKFLKATGADAVFWNRCYEPDLLQRDEEMRVELGLDGLTAESFKAELLVEPWELSNSGARPAFDTFHMYMRSWMAFPPPPQPFPCPSRLRAIDESVAVGHVRDLGLVFSQNVEESMSKLWTPGSAQAKIQLEKFLQEIFPVFGEGRCRRHFKGTSRLSPHVRFGELSPRRMYHATRVCVSRWDPNSDVSPALAALGVPADGKANAARMSHNFRRVAELGQQETIEDVESDEENEDTESSACGSLRGNFTRPPVPLHNGHRKRLGRKPRSVKATNGTESASGDMDSFCTPVGVPHISRSAKAFLKNLCLRDFSYHVLFHHPDFDTKPLVPEFARFPWAPDEGSFEAWRMGNTGYPLVDAAMRELRSTGWVHNTMRFLLACFLSKYLLLPWQRGLKEFYNLLLDGDHSSNALGWQWTSGSNTDAFPFSCLVNPVKVGSILDPKGEYIRRWVPELANLSNEFIHQPWRAPESIQSAAGLSIGETYPSRVVVVGQARRRAKEAMLHMKRIFAEVRPGRRLSSLSVDDLLRDWPQRNCVNDCCALWEDTGVLPSLWPLLPSGDSPSPAKGGSTNPGHDTRRNNDIHNSIEHVLLTAHSAPGTESLVGEDVQMVDIPGSIPGRNGVSVSRKKCVRLKRPSVLKNTDDESVVPGSGSRGHHRSSFKDSINESVNGHQQPGMPSARIPAYGDMQQYPGAAPHHSPHPQHPAVMHSQINQVHQTSAQHQLTNSGMVYEGMYGSGMGPSNPAGVPMSNFSVLMSHGQSGVELGISNGINPIDFSNPALYAHQVHMSQMYGLSSMVPVLPSQRVGRPDGDQRANESASVNAGASGNARHMGVPPNFAMPFGMYGANPNFDPNGFANAMGMADPNQYAALHVGPHQAQPRTHARGAQPCITPHHMYIPPQGSVDGLHAANGLFPRTGQLNHVSHVPGGSHVVKNREIAPSGPNGTDVPGSEKRRDRAVISGKLAEKGPSMSPSPPGRGGDFGAGSNRGIDSTSVSHKPKVASLKSGTGGRGRNRNSTNIMPMGSGRQASSKANVSKNASPTRGRGGTRSKRGGGRAGRKKGEGRSVASGPGTIAAATNSLGNESAASALKARQEILNSVGQKDDHEYFHFARFLSRTYELTGNTDRQTSKDYIRLCTLKDNYHKQCQSDNEKLKIYRIKAFFSQILELEVTGEWDRHNHGGVRGPYVYGIRLKPLNPVDGDPPPAGKKPRKSATE